MLAPARFDSIFIATRLTIEGLFFVCSNLIMTYSTLYCKCKPLPVLNIYASHLGHCPFIAGSRSFFCSVGNLCLWFYSNITWLEQSGIGAGRKKREKGLGKEKARAIMENAKKRGRKKIHCMPSLPPPFSPPLPRSHTLGRQWGRWDFLSLFLQFQF